MTQADFTCTMGAIVVGMGLASMVIETLRKRRHPPRDDDEV